MRLFVLPLGLVCFAGLWCFNLYNFGGWLGPLDSRFIILPGLIGPAIFGAIDPGNFFIW